MPLKKMKVAFTKNPHPVKDPGNPIQRGTEVMSLFKPALLPRVTLNPEQFVWPEFFAVMGVRRVETHEVNPETGWDLKHGSQKVATGGHETVLQVIDGGLAMAAMSQGQDIVGLPELEVRFGKDIPVDRFVPKETTITLVKPVVMLGFGGSQADRLYIHAEDYQEVGGED